MTHPLPPDAPTIGPNHVVIPYVLWQRMAACYYGGAPRYAQPMEEPPSAASTTPVREIPYQAPRTQAPSAVSSAKPATFVRRWKPEGVTSPEEMPE